MYASTLIDAVLAQAGTDASRTTLLSLLNESYASQVVRSRWLLETVSLGNTVAGTADYSLPDGVVDILGLRVGNYEFTPIGPHELWNIQASGSAAWNGQYGYFAPTYSSTGGTSITLSPTPTDSGTAITVLTPAVPTDLTDTSNAAGTPVTPSDMHGSLIDGTIALVLLRIDERPDLAQPLQQRFDDSIERLRRRKNSRPGRGMQALLHGVHWY